MQQPFKIRKNKSQKDMLLSSDHSKKSPIMPLKKGTKTKPNTNLQSCKSNHLEPLVKNKGSTYNPIEHTTQIKLDYTQPVPHKSSSLNKYESKNDGFHLIPLDINLPLKPTHIDKQNRSTSINEIKCPTIAKVQSNLLRTDKYETMKVYVDRAQVLTKNRSEKQNTIQMKKRQGYKTSKLNLLKTSSKSKLNKIGGKTTLSQSPFYNTQMQTQPDLHTYKTFRKGIISKIFNSRNNLQELNMIAQTGQIQSKQLISKANQAKVEDEGLKSPLVVRKDLNLFQINCSTIKEQEQSCQSFISKGAYEELVNFKNIGEPSPFVEHKLCNDRRIKMETDRIKKKFPQNFFK